MNLRDEQNRLALQTWVAEMRASVKKFEDGFAKTSIPNDPNEALVRLQNESESKTPSVERAISYFSRTRHWPADLSESESFYVHLRVMAACRLIDFLLSGEVTNPDIVDAVGSDKMNFTEWMLTTAWGHFGESYLRTLFAPEETGATPL